MADKQAPDKVWVGKRTYQFGDDIVASTRDPVASHLWMKPQYGGTMEWLAPYVRESDLADRDRRIEALTKALRRMCEIADLMPDDVAELLASAAGAEGEA